MCTAIRQRYGFKWVAPLALVLGITACGGSDGANDDRPAQQPQTNAPPQAQSQTPLSLSGCVETGPGTNQFVLRNVRIEGNAPSAGEATRGSARAIVEGSVVRLAAADRDLSSYAGQRVSVRGIMTDSGQNTIGTAGSSGVETPSGDRSQAASGAHHSEKVKQEAGRIARESMANATSPEMQVQQIEGTGERCQSRTERTQ